MQKITLLIISIFLLKLAPVIAQDGIFESYAVLNANAAGNQFYDLQAFTANPDFQGADLGIFTTAGSLVIAGGENKTYKCAGCNISGSTLYYRVWKTVSGPLGAFTSINLPFSSDLGASGCGGLDQKWQETTNTANILSGLETGSYILEIYTESYSDCSGTVYSSNGGFNFTATFTVSCPAGGSETIWYIDADMDTYGGSATYTYACEAPSGYVASNDDCDDTNAAISPGATEVCNNVDDDCSGTADNGLLFQNFYPDSDGDSYGGAVGGFYACGISYPGYVTNNLDCNEIYATINPGVSETCNGYDDNCDGLSDEGLTYTTYYADGDGDGYGYAFAPSTICYAPGAGYVTDSTDCDDATFTTHPGATETCNTLDDDCNGLADDGIAFANYYPDSDGDGYGGTVGGFYACGGPYAGYVTNNLDCNDIFDYAHPGGTETCNGVDDDCNGTTDDGAGDYFYADTDGDFYGDPAVSVQACFFGPAGFVGDSTDCDDTDNMINPGGYEICNSLDDNCNGTADEGLGYSYMTWSDPTTICKPNTVTLTAATCTGCTYQWNKNGGTVTGATSFVFTAHKSGTYTVTTTLPGGCSAVSNDVTISILPPPNAYISYSGSPDLAIQNPVKMKEGGSSSPHHKPGESYQWSKDGMIIPGATNRVYSASIAGDYTVTTTNSNGCSRTSAVTTIYDGIMRLGNLRSAESLRIYPNPNSGSFTLQPGSFKNAEAEIYIYNTLGEIVYSAQIRLTENMEIEISLNEHVQAGCYIARIISGDEEQKEMFILQK